MHPDQFYPARLSAWHHRSLGQSRRTPSLAEAEAEYVPAYGGMLLRHDTSSGSFLAFSGG